MSIEYVVIICLLFGGALGFLIGFSSGRTTFQMALDSARGWQKAFEEEGAEHVKDVKYACAAFRYVMQLRKLSIEELERMNRIWQRQEEYP